MATRPGRARRSPPSPLEDVASRQAPEARRRSRRRYRGQDALARQGRHRGPVSAFPRSGSARRRQGWNDLPFREIRRRDVARVHSVCPVQSGQMGRKGKPDSRDHFRGYRRRWDSRRSCSRTATAISTRSPVPANEIWKVEARRGVPCGADAHDPCRGDSPCSGRRERRVSPGLDQPIRLGRRTYRVVRRVESVGSAGPRHSSLRPGRRRRARELVGRLRRARLARSSSTNKTPIGIGPRQAVWKADVGGSPDAFAIRQRQGEDRTPLRRPKPGTCMRSMARMGKQLWFCYLGDEPRML